MERKEIINLLYIALLILTVIGVGLFALNQAMTWFYKAEFLAKPCDLCLKLNNNLSLCPKTIINNNFLNLTLP